MARAAAEFVREQFWKFPSTFLFSKKLRRFGGRQFSGASLFWVPKNRFEKSYQKFSDTRFLAVVFEHWNAEVNTNAREIVVVVVVGIGFAKNCQPRLTKLFRNFSLEYCQHSLALMAVVAGLLSAEVRLAKAVLNACEFVSEVWVISPLLLKNFTSD